MNATQLTDTQEEANPMISLTSLKDIGRRFSEVMGIVAAFRLHETDLAEEVTDSSLVGQDRLHVVGLEPSESTQRALEQLERDDMPTFPDSESLFAYLKG